MPTPPPPAAIPVAQFWAGVFLTGLSGLFLLFDSLAKLLQAPQVLKSAADLGLPPNTTVPIGCILLACTTLYLIPPTALLGAILLTGYLGGAVAIHVRAGSGAFPIIFSGTFGLLVWAGLALRDPRLLALILLRRW